jgi:hypothetical protein
MVMKIGLSLSRCVKDIVNGVVHIDDVYCIVTGTRAVDDRQWLLLMGTYGLSEWRGMESTAMAIANVLRDSGRIVQPRVLNIPPPSLARSIWIEVQAAE